MQIFRVFDALINLFPGLSSVLRRGVDRDKIVNLFSRISMKELRDPAFEIPNLAAPPSSGNLALPQDSTSKNKS